QETRRDTRPAHRRRCRLHRLAAIRGQAPAVHQGPRHLAQRRALDRRASRPRITAPAARPRRSVAPARRRARRAQQHPTDRGRPMKRGSPERETCELNGWGVGTRLVGDEGYGPTVIRITAIGERMLLAVCETERHGGDCPEASWTLTCREWSEVAR